MVANTEMGKNNISVDPPATGQVGCGAVAIAAALFSRFYQGSLGFKKLNQGWYKGWPWHGRGVPHGPVWKQAGG